ncbi:MAG: hypothetical protein E6G67_08670 [Actinobacteria bacterium]|nr:MAG: hypothetical protein E6G67_08670 [Actinomycetota bacterium]
MDYTYRSYDALLGHIRACGRTICAFRDIGNAESFVVLRHDVDYSVVKAREMAERECHLGVRSTYFLLLTSPYYNLLAADNLRAARDIIGMGHEIGLHYDTDFFSAMDHDAQCRRVVDLARFLAESLGTEVTSIAQHNPSETAVRLCVPEYVDAYGDRFFREIAYVSDSRRLFGTLDLYGFFRTHARSQLLIHPLWWHDSEQSRWQSFTAIRDGIVQDVESRLTRMNASMEADELKLRR